MNENDIRKVIVEGFSAAIMGVEINQNPHNPDLGNCWAAWRVGWRKGSQLINEGTENTGNIGDE